MTTQRQTVERGTHSISPDGPTLDFALHHPTDAGRSCRAALIAHPYGRLGGCKEDHVVVALAEKLASEGWTVLRYDARGAGASTGSVSWTCVQSINRWLIRDHATADTTLYMQRHCRGNGL